MSRLHLILLVAGAALTLVAASSSLAGGGPETPPPAARGLVYAGLRHQENGPCGPGFRLEIPAQRALCTHGPDPAPDGVDVQQPRDTAQLASTTTSTAAVPCIGDGTSGPRVQAVYAVASDQTDRYATVAPLIANWAGEMDQALNQSAGETGGERHIRFVTDSSCALAVAHVVLSPTGDDSFSNTISELAAQGYGAPDRKYLIWMDAGVYCGIAEVTEDDSPGSANQANTTTGYARVDSGCWGRTDHLSELHELMHNLGAVQLSAPHSTGNFHCTDEYDAMCYQDALGVTLTYPCASSHEWLLDCNHDDYFSTAPPTGSYLATHWNAADSVFLQAGPVSSGASAGLALVRTASPTTYGAVGQTITYGYTLTNSGATTLGPAQFAVSDSRVGGGSPFACGAASTTLAAGASVACSAGTAVTQADLDSGSIDSTATASGGGATSAPATISVSATQSPALSLSRTASPTSYSALGDAVVLGYTVVNSGNVTLGPAQFTISDSAFGTTPFACGATSTLAPGSAVSCSATYTVTQADLDAGSLTSSASATGGGPTSPVVTTTIQKAATTASTTFTGSVSAKKTTKSFPLAVGNGTTAGTLQFSTSGKTKTAPSLTLRVLAPDGSVVAQATGASVLRLTTPALARGTYTWQVSGSTSASFTLQVTYASP